MTADVARGHLMHQMGEEQGPRRRTMHRVHQIDIGAWLEPRYGHVVHI